MSTPFFRQAVAMVALAVLLPALALGLRGPGTRTVSAEFDRTVALFEGSEVRVMGLPVGEVTRITPQGTKVRVDMEYDAEHRLPAEVRAVIVAPSVISDRFVQLTPAYVDGPTLPTGAVIELADTRVPVELDRSLETSTELMKALGPRGANRDGALSDLLTVMADVLEGTGSTSRSTLRDLARVSDTLGAGADDAADTVEHLAGISGTLAEYDADVRAFNRRLASVSGALAQDSARISELLRTLAGSLAEVEAFVRENRTALVRDVDRLAGVTGALLAERRALAEILDIAPLAFTNLTETYDAQAQAVRTRANFGEVLKVVDRVVCESLAKSVGPELDPLCAQLHEAILEADPR